VGPRDVVTIEAHTIDFVPLSERYGTPRRLFTIWFSANMTILGVALGALGVEAGLSAAWTTAAIVSGNAIGTIFMAAHSAQGPQLGIPQMIQSRAQFGVRGAGIPLVVVVLTYLLYCAANGVLIQGPIKSLVPMSDGATLAAFAVATLGVAFIGYELIHRIGAVLTFVSAALFLTAACLLISTHATSTHGGLLYPAAPITPFNHAAFMVMMTQAAAWALSYGPYVADYSRYLPPSVPASKTFWYTALGCWLSSTLVMTFGAYFAAIAPDLIKDPGNAIASAFGPGRPIVELLIIIAIIQGNVMNLYSAYMSVVTIYSGLRATRRVGRAQKLAVMVTLMVIATSLSLLAEKNFNAYFADMLSAMIYLLVPWSAINLADYYVIRNGKYNIPDMFRVEGEYGAYRWKTIGVYFVGILAQTPFISLSFYQGAIAHHLGADIAWVPGLLVPGVLHILVEKSRWATVPSRAPLAISSSSAPN
jgi:nucleobase:cation symporter-1, NCS1 family